MTRLWGWSFVVFMLLATGCGGGAKSGDGGAADSAAGDSAMIDAGRMDAAMRDATTDSGSGVCGEDLECDDGLFCNGVERCAPADRLADMNGCAPSAGPCMVGQTCNEAAARCLTECDVTGDADGDGHDSIDCAGDDCDDADALRYPGNVEVCDEANHDEDCDPETFGAKDVDGDSVVDAVCCNARADGSLACGGDCDDLTRTTHPGSPEVCDGRDNDCNGTVDDGVRVDGFADMDGDLHGDPAAPVSGCPGDGRFASAGDDCDDTNARVHPGQVEVCDGLDDDCNGAADDGTGAADWYPDADGDGYGDGAGATFSSCRRPAGHSLLGNDCDDTDPGSSPGASERCDGIDNNCDGRANFEVGGAGSGDFEDDDHDGYPDAACAPAGTVADCDDTNPFAHPGTSEICDDGTDNDCDGTIDNDCAPADWYPDADGDGWGDASASPTPSMTPVAGSVTRAGDCDDTRRDVSPSERDLCDGVDNDCDGVVDGGAGRRCSGERAIMVCRAGACETFECERGWGDCGSDPGCETNVMNSPGNCGACGSFCFDGTHGIAACTAGSCDLSCTAGYANCDGDLTSGCEVDTLVDALNCGVCGTICSARPHATPACAGGTCGFACDTGWADCDGDVANGCEVHTTRDLGNCGACGATCPVAGDVCISSSCTANPFPSDGSAGSFAPTVSTILPAGVYQYTTITIPSGVTVSTNGIGVLELRATGDVAIDGTIDVSGGIGAVGGDGCAGDCGGGGGATGQQAAGQAPTSTACGAPGPGGGGIAGGQATASAGPGSAFPCRTGGTNGGGVGAPGGTCRFVGAAGGGGGYAGGGGGGCPGATGGAGASGGGADVGGAGAIAASCSGPACVTAGAGGVAPGAYAGSNGGGPGGQTGGGGGSIGAEAVGDLAVTTTFRAGSGGGGGGSQDASNHSGGGGGGGGGGALRVTSGTMIVVRGQLFADGGQGGRGGGGVFSPASSGGGGGSAGLIYLAAPSVRVEAAASVRTIGGLGGRPGAGGTTAGGTGGLGRIRVMSLPAECSLEGSLTPPSVSSCAATPTPVDGRVYVGIWPN